MHIKILLLAFIFFSESVFGAENVAEILLDSANNAYVKKDYNQSLKFYQEILKTGNEAAEIYYNIGNCYFKLNQITNAIYFYEKARLLAPNDKDILYNLEISRQYTTDKIKTLEPFIINKFFRNLVSLFSSNFWATISMVCFIGLLVFLLLFLFLRNIGLKKSFFWLGIILLLISVSSYILSYSQKKMVASHLSAIVFSPTVNIKSSPDENGIDLLIIHEGIKVTITDSLQDWYNVVLPDNNEGWLLKTDIKKI